MKVVVIGGGAAGFFSAINIAEKIPTAEVIILEKSKHLLQKVKVSGGGRCNVTNGRSKPSELVHYYPRGSKKLHSVFKQFTTTDMVDWLAQRSVETKVEDDLRVFPSSDSSQTIIDCFLTLANKKRIQIFTRQPWTKLQQKGEKWLVGTKENVYLADAVIVATGSSPAAWGSLSSLGLRIGQVVPSLFTFNISDERLNNLQGISFEKIDVKVVGTKLQESGPLLITHWGLSGPAILKLSSRGAYTLSDRNYLFEILINFVDSTSEGVREHLMQYKQANPKRTVIKYPLFGLPRRFWEQLIATTGVATELPYGDLSKKQLNKVVEELTQGKYKVTGKSTFKEEFVTAGGVELSEINLNTFECKRFSGLYLAGEVVDIDALTGGFNFQACWSAGWIISEHLQTR